MRRRKIISILTSIVLMVVSLTSGITAQCETALTHDTSGVYAGDVNNDGTIDVSDVVMLWKYLVKLSVLTDEQWQNSDLNNDAKVNVFDVVYLKRKLMTKTLTNISPDLSEWEFYTGNGGEAEFDISPKQGTIHADVSALGQYMWDVEVFSPGITLGSGKYYEISFEASADPDNTIRACLSRQRPDGSYIDCWNSEISLSSEMQKYTFNFVNAYETADNWNIGFDFGIGTGAYDIKNISLNEFTYVPQSEETELNDGYTGFIQTNGRTLQDKDGKDYLIKGIAFGNNISENPSFPLYNCHHTEDSYRELSELGFNSVRFYLNYGLFEDDSNPYEYKEAGFEWLKHNINWAKKYGIRLILNMHYPQGGYQSGGKGGALWTDEENQKRLTALWTEIARRYADEPAIIGYGLVNEPVVAIKTNEEDCLNQWQELAQTITDSIRTVDTNHLIFMECMCATLNMDTGNTNWSTFNNDQNFMLIDDKNVVYEFHNYYPHSFTHQDLDWAGTAGKTCTYPDDSKSYNKVNLEYNVNNYVRFSVKYNVPIYCGEFGAGFPAFEENRGGDVWVSDTIDLFVKYNVGFNYHDYHEYSFGLYRSSSISLPDNRNELLYNIFKKKLAENKNSSNLITNADNWSLVTSISGNTIEVKDACNITVNSTEITDSNQWWNIQAYYPELTLESGKTYRLTYTIRADSDCLIFPHIQSITGEADYLWFKETATKEAVTYTHEITMKETCSNAKLAFDCGYQTGTYYITDISLICVE